MIDAIEKQGYCLGAVLDVLIAESVMGWERTVIGLGNVYWTYSGGNCLCSDWKPSEKLEQAMQALEKLYEAKNWIGCVEIVSGVLQGSWYVCLKPHNTCQSYVSTDDITLQELPLAICKVIKQALEVKKD